MKTADIGAGTVEYRVVGSGEPVVMIHGAFIADSFRPLVQDASLSQQYQLLTYRRRGYGGSTGVTETVSVADHASDCLALLDTLEIERAHIVGHSYGGSVALQLTAEAPSRVQTLMLLEPAYFSRTEGPEYRRRLLEGQKAFRQASPEAMVDGFFKQRLSGDYRALLERLVPGGFEQAVADAATFFEYELPGLLNWTFGNAELSKVERPVLMVLGERSNDLWARFGETHDELLSALPNAEGHVVPCSAHLLQLENPADLAAAMLEFWSRHSM